MTARQTYDVIVVGIGGMVRPRCTNSPAADSASWGSNNSTSPTTRARRTASHRVIRLAYYEDPSYVPLVRRAFGALA